MIIINGIEKDSYDGKLLPDVLAGERYPISQIAVEINGEIVPKTLFSETVVRSGDRLEVVSFVGGG